MPALPNARHEAFCRALAEGHSIDESYSLAGYSKNRGNASRLNANESVQARLRSYRVRRAVRLKVTLNRFAVNWMKPFRLPEKSTSASDGVAPPALKAKLQA